MVDPTKKTEADAPADVKSGADDRCVIVINADEADKATQDPNYGKAYLKDYTTNDVFLSILSKKGIRLLMDDYDKIIYGGNGIIYRCLDEYNNENSTVLKITSSRKSGVLPEDLENGKHFSHEGCLYYLIDDDTKEKLVKPFRIRLADSENNTVDYLNCYHFPLYKELSYALNKDILPSKVEKERAILDMIRDVLSYIGNNQNIRHRDIKPDNIMYDSEKRKFVLIDWGDAIYNLPLSADGAADKSAAEKAFTDYYVDPHRLECEPGDSLKVEYDFRIDLYSLGVVMAYLAHPDGWFAKNDISRALSSEEREVRGFKYHVVMKAELMASLNDSSIGYRNIVKKALSHSYDSISEMAADIDALIKDNSNTKNFAGSRKLHPLWGFGIAAVLLVISILSSGYEGMVASMFTGKTPIPSYLLLAICALLPMASSIFKILKAKKNELPDWCVYLNNMDLLGILVVFLITTAITHIFLAELNMTLTLDVVCAMFLFSVLIPQLTSGISRGKNVSSLRLMICGGLLGLGIGICLASCISVGDSSRIFSADFVKLIAELVVLGAALGIVINMIAVFIQSFITKVKPEIR